ncbi:Olfactory receptor 7D2 [Camelus dromedarius]|uniref:Olfactory receptor n=1 Tax=Camelus dromedarius TaxID=9838 RepID=A0A5N4CJS6_CAMDR|nr:Olfactory receptor 7D2 [Camelus dromedarius]
MIFTMAQAQTGMRYPDLVSGKSEPESRNGYLRYISYMEAENRTGILEFILLGFSENPELKPLIFWLFLLMYLVTVLGNLLIILAIISDSHLHTPMYFFLSNLSLVDICFSTTTVPRVLLSIHTENKAISYMHCLTQVYFTMFFPILDTMLLTAMAYDRFVAICHPLHYTVIMNLRLCALLVFITWFIGVTTSLLHISLMMRLTFCWDLEIPHFFCELTQILQLACSDTFLNSTLIYVMTGVLGVGVYFTSAVTHSSQKVSVASVMYTVVTPMLNPFVYSLRNTDVKGALRRLLSQATSCLR